MMVMQLLLLIIIKYYKNIISSLMLHKAWHMFFDEYLWTWLNGKLNIKYTEAFSVA